jgi:hypothetical protein
MSMTPTAIIRSASPRPYAGASLLVSTQSTGTLQVSPFGHDWVCGDHMSTEHNPVTVHTFGSKRLHPGSFAGVLT